MDQEQNIQPEADITKLVTMNCEAFFSSLNNQEVSHAIEIDRLPTKEEIIDAASNPFEIIIIQTEDGAMYAAKGAEHDAKFEDVRRQIENKKIKMIGHTHPFQDKGNREKSMFYSSLPSAGDLTSKGSGAERQYIFNTFGRISFLTMDNLGPHAEDAVGARSISQTIINSAMSVAARESGKQGIRDIPEVLNFLGTYMDRMFGVGFKFESWDTIEDPFSSTQNF